MSLPYKQFLGFEKGPNDLPQIVESEAKVVRLIYQLFLEGQTTNAIAKRLEQDGFLSPAGKKKWTKTTIEHILTNEKYKGDAILQKTFTVDFLTKKKKVNEGEVPQYYVKNSHPAIISPEVFDLVQAEIARRREIGYISAADPFSSKIICSECGGFYGSKVWHSNSKYRRIVWQCNQKFKNGTKCRTPHLYEDMVKTAFIEVANRLIQEKTEILISIEAITKALSDTKELDEKASALKGEIDELAERIQMKIYENTQKVSDQDAYQRQYDLLMERYRDAEHNFHELERQRQERQNRERRMITFINTLQAQDDLISAFDESFWNALVESVTVHDKKKLAFRFKDGIELLWPHA